MRFALSAAAAISGLGLLTLAFFGQPGLYLYQARQQWDSLLASPADDRPIEPDNTAVSDRMARLQQQVVRLETELSTRQNPAPIATPPALEPSPAAPPEPAPIAIRPNPPGVANTEPATEPMPPSIGLTERHEPTAQPPTIPPAAVQPTAPQPAAIPVEPAKPEPVRAAPHTPEPPKPAVQKLASVKPAPAPAPLPQVSPPRPAVDDTKSVLTRLRQQSPASPPAQAQDAPPAAEPKLRAPPSPSVPRLAAARAALLNGRVEDARRLLQEAQLQLVFRQVETVGEDPSSAASSTANRGAANVARALEALSANDVPLSRRYIDVAVNDLSGNATDAPVQQTDRRTPGYAPAYPPR